ncbi:MAG: response regulator [Anaerolineae bacterium]|nr:response regulator [Anaerolineae bacterium]
MDATKGLILIADDEENMVQLLKRLFEHDGFQVEAVSDGMSALQRAVDLQPELILMDVMMPGLNGFEVIKQLRQSKPTARIPTIFISAAAKEPTDIVRGLGLGADDYVLKPFNPQELLARARSKIRARQLEEDLERRNKELEALVRVGHEFNQRLKLDDLLDLIVSVCAAELPACQVAFCLLDQQLQVTDWRALHHNSAYKKADIQALVDHTESILGWLLQAESSVHIADMLQRDPLFEGCRSLIGTRIVHHGELLGLIALGYETPGCYDEGHLRLLESITGQAALAIRNAELYAELRYYALNLENMVAERTAELRAAQSQLIRSEKLASLGRLAAGIAHEVNNPLQAIRNCLELAIEDIDAHRPVDRELLTVAEQDVERIRRIVSQLLDFSRRGSSDLRPLEVGEAVRSVLRLVDRQLERSNIKLVTEINSTAPVQINEDQFKQVVLNLLLNAQEAMPAGGTLWVRVEQLESEVLISVTDTGIGIPEHDMPKIFDPFFSTKVDGTGLGLAVSYGIVEGHGGRIEVRSRENHGSTFTVRLPAYRQP